MNPEESCSDKNRLRRCKSIDPGFHERTTTWTDFKNRRSRKKELDFAYSNPNDNDNVFDIDKAETKCSTLEEEIQHGQIKELEEYKFETELLIKKLKDEAKAEKERADTAEKEVQELHSHINKLNVLQKEKENEYAEYKNAAEFYISKSDSEKAHAIEWADNSERDLAKFQRTINYLQRQLGDERFTAEREAQKKSEEIQRLQIQYRRLMESFKDIEQKNDKLDLEAIKCRKAVLSAEEELNKIYKSVKKMTSKRKKQIKKENTERKKEIFIKKLFTDLKKTKKNVKQLKNSLSNHPLEKRPNQIPRCRRGIHFESRSSKPSSSGLFGR